MSLSSRSLSRYGGARHVPIAGLSRNLSPRDRQLRQERTDRADWRGALHPFLLAPLRFCAFALLSFAVTRPCVVLCPAAIRFNPNYLLQQANLQSTTDAVRVLTNEKAASEALSRATVLRLEQNLDEAAEWYADTAEELMGEQQVVALKQAQLNVKQAEVVVKQAEVDGLTRQLAAKQAEVDELRAQLARKDDEQTATHQFYRANEAEVGRFLVATAECDTAAKLLAFCPFDLNPVPFERLFNANEDNRMRLQAEAVLDIAHDVPFIPFAAPDAEPILAPYVAPIALICPRHSSDADDEYSLSPFSGFALPEGYESGDGTLYASSDNESEATIDYDERDEQMRLNELDMQQAMDLDGGDDGDMSA